MTKRLGKQTVKFSLPPSILIGASVVGKKEGEGPLKNSFDMVEPDTTFGESRWEMAESRMQNICLLKAMEKGGISSNQLEYVFAGDLLNQCIGSAFALSSFNVPYIGIYGACSNMAEGLMLGAMLIDGGFAKITAAITSSHFCSAERQYRFPLEYGGERTPSSQWTVTGSGCVILSENSGGPYITHATAGKITDKGIADASNMGAAMAPAAYETITAFFGDTGTRPDDFDAVITGDLGHIGRSILNDFFESEGIKLREKLKDCGVMIFNAEEQRVGAGGSGCGCSAAVLAGHIIGRMKSGRWNRVLFCGTGALLSQISSQQGSSIPSICHAVCISNER